MKITIQTDCRSRLYFDQWQYSIAIFQSRISDIRGLNREATLELIKFRKESKFLHQYYTPESITKTLAALDFFCKETEPFKLTLSGNWAYVYTNDKKMLSRLEAQCPDISIRVVKQAQLSKPRDVVLLSESKYTYRTYFRSRWVEDQELVILNNFFTAQQEEHINPCGSFKKFLKSNIQYRSHWLANHYFVDHNDPKYPLMINLILPRATRKTMPIVQRINN